MRFKLLLSFALLITISMQGSAQCTTTVSTFPYVEDFETSTGGWTSGGTSGNDWAWGTPQKSRITTAGSGTKCWVTGGLTGSFYNYGERSWVMSPCFDFSNLQHPFIAFLIYWASEHIYDGLVLQYSLNNGTTWINVGTTADSANCMTANWYNTTSVTNLSGLANPKEGWTGNSHATSGSCQGTGGSLAWVQAKHCLAQLAGQPSVKFRFAFGAGTTCNNFDGIAFDSVSISEAPINTADFSHTCLAYNQLSFTGITAECPDSFAWNFGDPSSGAANTATTKNATHTFSGPGSYTVTFTAGGPCNAPATVSKVIDVIRVTANGQNVLCLGGASGAVDLTVTGGSGPYTYAWGNGATTQTISNLAAGTYSVTVTDPLSCPSTATITISQPATGVSGTTQTVNATCAVGGSITATGAGGTGPYTYNWGGGVTSQTRTGLGAGTYTVTITDANGCTGTASATISSTSTFVATPTVTNVSCNGGSNGAVNIALSGGRSPYNFVWGNGATTQNLTGLAAGSYSLTVTDSSGCIATSIVSVTQPQQLVVTDSAANISCNGGSNGQINTIVRGGTSPYGYNWGGGITTANRSGLGAGTYTVTVTDGHSCTAQASATISQPQAITITDSVVDALCAVGGNGSVSVTVSGGVSPYRYNWSNSSTTSSISNLGAGSVSVTVTDASSCTATLTATVTAPPAMVITATGTTTDCAADTGSVYVSVSGGVGGYTYHWSDGATTQSITNLGAGTYSVTVKDDNNCSATASGVVSPPTNAPQVTLSAINTTCANTSDGQINLSIAPGNYVYTWSNGATTQNITGLASGTYIVSVQAGINCLVVQSAFVNSPAPLAINLSAVNAKCFGAANGSITSSVTGGNPGYHYNWSNTDTTATITNIGPGTYTVIIIDQNGCADTASVAISQPTQLAVSSHTDSTNCGLNNGRAIVTVSGGTLPYTYSWQPNVSANDTANAIAAGNYRVVITDSAGCTIADTLTVGARPDSLVAPNLGPDTTICPGTGNIVLNAGSNYNSYFWQDSSTLATYTATDSGTFWVRVTGINGCTAADTILIGEKCNTKLVIPSAFSPNGDGKNDFFLPLSIDAPKKFVMHIYNRWGQLIFESNNIQNGWDGKFKNQPQPSGTYIYYIQYEFDTDSQLHGVEGSFTLLR